MGSNFADVLYGWPLPLTINRIIILENIPRGGMLFYDTLNGLKSTIIFPIDQPYSMNTRFLQ